MREIKRLSATAVALVLALLFVPAANADQSPKGCVGNDPVIRFTRDTLNQLEAPVRQGDSIPLGAVIDNSASTACDLSGVTVGVRLPNPDGSPGEFRVLATNVSLTAGFSVSGFLEVAPYLVDLDDDVPEASLELFWVANIHNREEDTRASGTGVSATLTMTRPRAEVRVTSTPAAGLAPLSVTNTYTLTNTSPSGPAGVSPALRPSGPGGAHDALSDAGCAPLTYVSGDGPDAGDGILSLGEAWTFTCTGTRELPGTYVSEPSITGVSTVDERPWPTSPSTVDATPVKALGPDLTVDKSHQGDLLAESSGEYTLRVTNSGNMATRGSVAVADRLPPGLTATSISGEGWSCDLDAVACVRFDPLVSGASFPDVKVSVAVGANPPPSVVNTAIVFGGGEIPPAAENNFDEDPTTIRTPAQPSAPAIKYLAISKVKSRRNGTVLIKVSVPRAGRLVVDDAGKRDLVRRASRRAGKAGTWSLVVKPRRKLRRQLKRRGHARRVRLMIRFVPRVKNTPDAARFMVRRVTFRVRSRP